MRVCIEHTDTAQTFFFFFVKADVDVTSFVGKYKMLSRPWIKNNLWSVIQFYKREKCAKRDLKFLQRRYIIFCIIGRLRKRHGLTWARNIFYFVISGKMFSNSYFQCDTATTYCRLDNVFLIKSTIYFDGFSFFSEDNILLALRSHKIAFKITIESVSKHCYLFPTTYCHRRIKNVLKLWVKI